MGETRVISRYKGIGDVILKGNPVARVRYHIRHSRIADAAWMDEVCDGEATARIFIDGSILVLKPETSLYSDIEYTLCMEDRHDRECDFYARPIDVVTGRYYLEGIGDFRKPCRRQSPP